MKERDSGVKAITTALKALPAEEQMATLLAKYAEMAEENKRLQVQLLALIFINFLIIFICGVLFLLKIALKRMTRRRLLSS